MEVALETTKTPGEQDATRKQIRGSSLFLFGRMLSLGINFFTQVLMVRYLSTRDYGELAYGLAVVSFLRIFASLGLQDAIPRFVPIYRENREYGRMFGTILLAVGAVLVTGLLIVVVIWNAPLFLMPFITHEGLPTLAVFSILIVLVPVETADALLDGLFASLAGTRDIFFRRYLLGPGLKFGVVALLLWMKSTIIFLACGYLLAGATGVLIYGVLFINLLRKQNLLQHLRLKEIAIPARETLAFVLPGLVSTLATCIAPVHVFLLGRLRTMPEVAFYRAAVPIADLNSIVFASFTLLYTPLANLVVSAVLIKLYGTIGAGIGSAVTLIGYNLLLQVGLLPTADFHVFDRRYFWLYLTIALAACGLFFVGWLTSLSLYVLLPLAACVSLC